VLTLTVTDPGDPLRNIRVVRAEHAAALQAGEMFNPDWINRIKGVQGVRFMDWMATNNSTISGLTDRPMPTDFTFSNNGVPIEVMVALANRLDCDAWFTMPHMASDALIRFYADYAHTHLEPVE
jgi:hypothetical protein